MQFVIQGRPITKKNSMQILGMGRKCPFCGRPAKSFISPSKQYKKYETEAIRQLLTQVSKMSEPINERVNVKCIYYMPTAQICDLPNLEEATDDILVKAKILEDDNYTVIAGHDGSRVYIDRMFPRVEITIDAAR